MADKDDDWDDEELLLVTGRGSKAAGKKRRKASDSEDDDNERPARAQKPASNKRRSAPAAAADSDEDNEGMDEEERRKLDSMNELEREMYLFEREEILQRQRERKQVLNQARKTDEQVEVRASSRRPRNQTGTDSAIGRIAAAHAQREAREKKKQQEEEEKQEKQQRRSRKQQEEEEAEAEEEEAQESGEDEEMAEEGEDDDELELELEGDDDEPALPSQQLGARAETYDEGTGSYEELEERASLEEVQHITLKRSDLEAWHNEPFFEDDVRGCLLRIVNTQEQARTGQPSYMLARIGDVVSRNSYSFPAGAKASRTRKWLHMDDLSGNGVFRHQMTMVSNSAVLLAEYDKALAKAQRGHAKFITKGDVQQAKERLQHARTFKYNPELVKKLLEKKRAAGKVAGSVAQHKARLMHEVNVARQEGKSEEEIHRIQDELDRLEHQEQQRSQYNQDLMQQALGDKDGERGASQGAKMPSDMALSLINLRNRDRNNLKIFQPLPAAGGAKAAAGGDAGGTKKDVFSRRHTQSKVYWATGKAKEAAAAGGAGDAGAAGGLQRQGSVDVSLLKTDLKTLDTSELIKVLDLSIDMQRLPRGQPAALLPKRLLGLRWLQSVEKRQQDMAGRSLLTLDDWKRKMSYQQMM